MFQGEPDGSSDTDGQPATPIPGGVPGNAADQAAVAISQGDYAPVVMESDGGGCQFRLDLPAGSEDAIWLCRLTVGDAEPIYESGETGKR